MPADLTRLLDLAAASGATPLVIVTGTGQVAAEARVAEVVAAAAQDVEVVHRRPDGGAGLARLRELVDGRRTLALVGATGRVTAPVARALVGADVIGAGRRRRGLALLPGGGAVLDLRHPAAPSLDGWTSSGGAR